jgi:hypothetical protein
VSNHGKLNKEGCSRNCDVHGCHGILYVCEEYTEDIQNEIKSLGEKFREDCKKGTINIFNNYDLRTSEQ